MPPTRLEMLQSFVVQKPNDPFVHYALAQEFKNLGRLEECWQTFEALMRTSPDYVASYFHAGDVLVQLGRPDDARKVYEDGLVVCDRAGDSKTKGEIQGALAGL